MSFYTLCPPPLLLFSSARLFPASSPQLPLLCVFSRLFAWPTYPFFFCGVAKLVVLCVGYQIHSFMCHSRICLFLFFPSYLLQYFPPNLLGFSSTNSIKSILKWGGVTSLLMRRYEPPKTTDDDGSPSALALRHFPGC